MSKTKEEILGPFVYSPAKAEANIHKAMTEWHDQELEVYKNKLRREIQVKLEYMMANPTDSSAADYGYITALNEIKDLIV